MGLSFPVVKLSDFEQHWPELEASANPFATVVMAHLQTRKTRRAPEARYQWKMRLVRRLYECGFERQDVLELFRFIDWVMALPPELEGRFNVEYRKIEEELEMRYITTVERHGIEQGRQEGLQQGVEKGLREGVEKGLRQGVEKGQREGEAALLRRLLLRRFEQLPSWAEERLDEANREQIESWSDRLFEAEQLEDVFGSTR
jgi:flagellar biosynthesis/type III secretory pathway protein FliH